ncbi:MAG: VOC family protein [Bacillus sp. (in: Bacteria)]|nr:VOC family protein [Bacillus sp. (in: firmicutes)]
MIKKVDHIGIAVKSLEATLPFYMEILNLPLLRIEEVQSQQVRVAFLQAGDIKLELLEPTSEESAIAKFIVKRGEGIHRISGVTGQVLLDTGAVAGQCLGEATRDHAVGQAVEPGEIPPEDPVDQHHDLARRSAADQSAELAI